MASRSAFHFPASVDVFANQILAWTEAPDAAGITHQGGGDLLGAFLALAQADTEEMAQFLRDYGIPELCVHALPDRHPDKRRAGAYCSFPRMDDGIPYVSTQALRWAARAFAAAVEEAEMLRVNRLPDPRLWDDMLKITDGVRDWPEVASWQRGRERLALWLTDLLRDCGVQPIASWERGPLSVTYEADGLLGTLAILLSRQLAQGETYTCDQCGTPVNRKRAPKPGEGVYCLSKPCRDAQNRRNQRAYRERQAQRGAN